MVPCSFDESNAVFGRPSTMNDEECVALSALQTATDKGLPVVVSCWKLTIEELEQVNRTGRIWLTICGDMMPPVCLDGFKPFSPNQPE